MSADRVHQFAGRLRQYATHFAITDWAYTRDVGDLRMFHTRSIKVSLSSAIEYLVHGVKDFGLDDKPGRLAMARAALRGFWTSADGVLDSGGVITIWEETGEYLQYVQPSVGALLADLMDAHPDLPEVVAIADEMKRINDDYHRRITAAGGETV